MKIKLILSLLLFLVPSVTLSCSAPQIGAKFDKLIKIERVTGNKFKAIIPKEAGNLNYGADIKVGYYPSNNEYRSGEYWKDIKIKEVGENYETLFDLKKIEGYTPFLNVFWFPEKCCLCGAYGKSEDIILK